MLPHSVLETADGVMVSIPDRAVTLHFRGVTLEQMRQGYASYQEGAFIQDAYPFLDRDQREFLLTGLTADQWDALFPEDE